MSSEDKEQVIHPSSGAIIMALGIFLYAAIEAFPLFDQIMGEVLTVMLAVLGVVIFKSLARQVFKKHFFVPFINNPVNSFVMGTWIAGISVLCNVVGKYFPGLSPVLLAVAFLDTVLYVLFLVSCVNNFKQLWKHPTRYSTHGAVLLSTVATQSLVILWVEMFPSLTKVLLIFAMSIGFIFYLCGVWLIMIRYGKKKQWSLAEDWTNTNCIIHGALSITGLAIVSSHMMSALLMMIFWLIVFALLIIIEALEISRAIKRVRRFGWKNGIFTYHVSQWSRNFTFGMFYAFTIAMHKNTYYMNAMYDFHGSFLAIWAWIVFVALIFEIGLWIEAKWHLFGRLSKEGAV
ncbi:hypothetical protein [Pseudalkalibacillus caeni]|uniref:Voltage-dependent anion channel n=1 Tax=Exobacillus caeni TaxID=2574798 RepID=A0A5R9F285_9BACL|nr:hypothetical protein [Pseudalkalibacillus caeni]TLS37191.1 hypothetical protein FCL54_11735 [Pseudalkalibacillus caeni]